MERLAFHATIEKKVPCKGTVQEKLNKLAESPGFKLILWEEVEERTPACP